MVSIAMADLNSKSGFSFRIHKLLSSFNAVP